MSINVKCGAINRVHSERKVYAVATQTSKDWKD